MTTELPISTPRGFDTIIAMPITRLQQVLPVNVAIRLIGPAVVCEADQLGAEEMAIAGICLRVLTRQCVVAGNLPPVRDAWFVLTTDVELVERFGMAHDCDTCRAMTDQALALLRDNPDVPLIVGVMAY